MATTTYCYLDDMSSSEFLDLLRRYAKAWKKEDDQGRALSWHQDQVAISLGFKNWSLLHKHLEGITFSALDKLVKLALKKADLGDFLQTTAVRTMPVEEAVRIMKEWARETYTPLNDFAFRDPESPTGFSWPEVEMAHELSEEFEGKFPDDLIHRVGIDLDVDEGPWGFEDYGDDDAG